MIVHIQRNRPTCLHTCARARACIFCDVQARPEKIVVIDNGKIAFKTGIGPYQYSTAKLQFWLEQKYREKLTWSHYLVYGVQ